MRFGGLEHMPGTVVYIVDDDDAVRDSLRLLLELSGLEVEDYPSTHEFSSKFIRPARGCVLLDQHLPVTSGLDFLTSNSGSAIGLPVIMITGRGDDALRARAEGAGVVAFLDKPVDGNRLLSEVTRALDLAA